MSDTSKKPTVRALIEKLMHPDFLLDDEIINISVYPDGNFSVETLEGNNRDEERRDNLYKAYNATTDLNEKERLLREIQAG